MKTDFHYFPMSASEFRAGLETLGMSQNALARLLDINQRTVRVWALGEGNIPSIPAIIIRLLVIQKISTDDVRDMLSTPVAFRKIQG